MARTMHSEASHKVIQVHAHFVAGEKCYILPTSNQRNQLHKALESERFEEASGLIASYREANLVECFQSTERCCKSYLHVIAALSDREPATKLCRQLLEGITNAQNRECLLNIRTVDEFDMGGWKVDARVAAIHISAYNGNSGVVRLLCQEYGVDANCSTSETIEEPIKGITALEWAARKGHVEVVKALLDNQADANASYTDGVTPLLTAAYEGHAEVVKLLLENKADVNATDTDGVTPLYIAVQNGHTEVVKLLLDNKADVNASKHNGVTPIFVAAQVGHTEVVKLLIDNKADVNASRHNGGHPLHIAAQNGHTEVVKLLIKNKADVNASRQTDGVTPLYIAAQNGHTEVVKLLLENKADVNASKHNGVTPVCCCSGRTYRSSETVDRQHG